MPARRRRACCRRRGGLCPACELWDSGIRGRGRSPLPRVVREPRRAARGAPADASRERERSGLGARGALPRGDRACPWRRRGRRPHPDRPGRDDPVPAGVLTEPAGVARHAASRGLARAAAARVHARGDGGLLRGARPRVARGRDERVRGVRAQSHPCRGGAGAARHPPGGGGQRARGGADPARGGGGPRRARRRGRARRAGGVAVAAAVAGAGAAAARDPADRGRGRRRLCAGRGKPGG